MNNGYFLISDNGSVSFITPQLQEEIDMEIIRMLKNNELTWKL